MVKNFNPKLEKNLLTIFQQYNQSFKRKNLKKDETSQDIIMDIFGKKQIDVDVNKQYWNREFGKFFEIQLLLPEADWYLNYQNQANHFRLC